MSLALSIVGLSGMALVTAAGQQPVGRPVPEPADRSTLFTVAQAF